MNDLKCWFCRRTAQEVYNDYEEIYDKYALRNDEDINDGIISSMVFEAKESDIPSLVSLRDILHDNLPVCDICLESIRGLSREMIIDDLNEGWEVHDALSYTIIQVLSNALLDILKVE